MKTVVSTSELAQGYGRKKIFVDLNIVITEGVFGLLGPNGAGKTTLLRTLATISPPMGGTLTICDSAITSDASARRVRRNIGYLPQQFGFFPSFSVYDFVRYCAWLRGVSSSEAHTLTLKAISNVDLENRKDATMKSLSGGMLRRAGIASAVVGSPRLLLLDEPTVGLDPEQRLEFRQLIRSFKDVAIVLSTHLVEDVAAICDDVAIIDAGEIRFRGTPTDLISMADDGAMGDSPLERGYMSALRASKAIAS